MSEVFLCQTGQLTPASRRELKRAGVVVVEVEDPAKCQFIRASETVSADDMLWAACDALQANPDRSYSGEGTSRLHRERFAVRLFELVDAAHSARRDRPAPPAALPGTAP